MKKKLKQLTLEDGTIKQIESCIWDCSYLRSRGVQGHEAWCSLSNKKIHLVYVLDWTVAQWCKLEDFKGN